LFVPKKRKFDPFSESLRGKLRRLVAGSDGFTTILGDSNANESVGARNSGELLRVHRSLQPIPLDPPEQIVRPSASPSDRFHEHEINQRSRRAFSIYDQTHLKTCSPDCHQKDALDEQFVGFRAVLFFCTANR
jgi:hypothetical protein